MSDEIELTKANVPPPKIVLPNKPVKIGSGPGTFTVRKSLD